MGEGPGRVGKLTVMAAGDPRPMCFLLGPHSRSGEGCFLLAFRVHRGKQDEKKNIA